MDTINAECVAYSLLQSIRKEYRNRRWGNSFAPVRKGGDTKMFFPPEYNACFAYQCTSLFFTKN